MTRKLSKSITFKGSTALSSGTEKAPAAAEPATKGISISLPVADPLQLVVSTSDPLDAVSAILAVSPESLRRQKTLKDVDEENRPVSREVETIRSHPWDFSAKMLEIGHQSTLSNIDFAGRYATAWTPQEILAVTADLYRVQGRMFKEHSEELFDMIAGSE